MDHRTTLEAAHLAPLLLLLTLLEKLRLELCLRVERLGLLSPGYLEEGSVRNSSGCAELQDSPWVMYL